MQKFVCVDNRGNENYVVGEIYSLKTRAGVDKSEEYFIDINFSDLPTSQFPVFQRVTIIDL